MLGLNLKGSKLGQIFRADKTGFRRLGHIYSYSCYVLGLGNISILSSYRNIYNVQYQYCQHFATCNNIACAIILLLQYHLATVYYRIVSTE